jgi:hypothetical protein
MYLVFALVADHSSPSKLVPNSPGTGEERCNQSIITPKGEESVVNNRSEQSQQQIYLLHIPHRANSQILHDVWYK